VRDGSTPHCIAQFNAYLTDQVAGRIVLAGNQKKTDDRAGQLAGLHTLPQRMTSMAAYTQNQAKKSADAPQALRDVAEKSTAQAKENIEKMSAATGEATNFLKNTCSTTFKGTQDYSAKILEFANANINAAVEQTTKLASVKSPVEFFALSNDYARQQFEILSRQVQELAAITQSMTTATMESVTAGVHKAT
jgi:phasin